ncbi:MAG TPA: FxsA family protein [Solirubrobacteraceae bacterium]|nr:FxsA family protein [Solirubrobacteraceae bacterium]
MLAVLLILWPIAEILAAVGVAHLIGVPLTILLLVLSWPAGLWLMRAEGRVAWRRLSAAVAAGRPPGREVTDGALVVLGGALLVVPGFITDLAGAALLLRPIRLLAGSALVRNFQSRLVAAAARFPGTSARSYDVDATATDISSTPARLPR